MSVGGIAKSSTTKAAGHVKNLLQTAIDFIVRALKISLLWTSSQIYSAIAALWRALRIEDLLYLIKILVLRVLKWSGIALLTVLGIVIICRLGHWGLPKLWNVCMRSLERSIEKRLRNNERRRLEVIEAERRLEHAAQAARLAAATLRQAERLKEAKLRQAREEQAMKDKLRRDEQERQAKAKADYMRWEKECDMAFRNKPAMTKFPFPPLAKCTNPKCEAFTERPVQACPDNVKQFFKGSGYFSTDLIKEQTHRLHGDRFASCRGDLKPEFQRLANSLFKILRPWHEELRPKGAKSSSVE